MSYDRYESQRGRHGASRRTTLGYWVPLVFTVTVATIGLAAWVWKERNDDDEYERDRKDNRPPPGYGDVGPGHTAYAPGAQPPATQDPGMMARMSGALRRTPSPQQIFDEASRRVAAGVAAAGAAVGGAVGGALSSIQEEDKRDYEDHSRWSEEAEARAGDITGLRHSDARETVPTGLAHSQGAPPRPGDKRKTVAIVVSADTKDHGAGVEDAIYFQEHAVSFRGTYN